MTPCYYCEFDRDYWCKRCIHDDKGFDNVDELLAALKAMFNERGEFEYSVADLMFARAAIAKAEGKQ